jgi:hypothetical protein
MFQCRYLESRNAVALTWQHVDHGQAVAMMTRILTDDREQGIKSSRAWVDGKAIRLKSGIIHTGRVAGLSDVRAGEIPNLGRFSRSNNP